jgi:multidrug resistance efflux pump
MNALSKRDLDAAQATYDAQGEAVNSAKAALSNARTQLSYARIIAPITGTIGISAVQVGDYVKNVGRGPTEYNFGFRCYACSFLYYRK